jgi:hypothetical protein
MDFTENKPELVKFHLSTSFSLVSWMLTKRETKECHETRLCPTNALRKEMFNGSFKNISYCITLFAY